MGVNNFVDNFLLNLLEGVGWVVGGWGCRSGILLFTFMTYSQKLRDPRWQKKRLEILQRDGFTCQSCNASDKELQVHHIVYKKRDPWDYPDYLYQTLCYECHEKRQFLTENIVDALRIAVAKVPTERMVAVSERLCAEAMLEIEVEA